MFQRFRRRWLYYLPILSDNITENEDDDETTQESPAAHTSDDTMMRRDNRRRHSAGGEESTSSNPTVTNPPAVSPSELPDPPPSRSLPNTAVEPRQFPSIITNLVSRFTSRRYQQLATQPNEFPTERELDPIPLNEPIAASSDSGVVEPSVEPNLNIEEIGDTASENDDPFCPQVLFFFGMCCGLPLFWIMGGILWFFTPRTHRRSRKWGLANLVLSVIFIPYLLTGFNHSQEETRMEDITMLTRGMHSIEEVNQSIKPVGMITFVDNPQEDFLKIEWTIDALHDLENWIPISFTETNEHSSLKNAAFGRIEAVVGDKGKSALREEASTSLGLSWPPPYSGLLSPAIELTGRLNFETSFGDCQRVSMETEANIKKAVEEGRAELLLRNDTKKTVEGGQLLYYVAFPNDVPSSDFLLSDSRFPARFYGTGLRCEMNDGTNKWLLQWKNVLVDERVFVSSTVVTFRDTRLCRVALVSTESHENGKEDTPYTLDVRKIVLRVLP